MADFTCIVCPNSCLITVEESDGSLKITGNQCKRGEEFAKNEYTHPMRMFTSTMKIMNAVIPCFMVGTVIISLSEESYHGGVGVILPPSVLRICP